MIIMRFCLVLIDNDPGNYLVRDGVILDRKSNIITFMYCPVRTQRSLKIEGTESFSHSAVPITASGR